MNLAKKGTVVLAALSVFAMASCGSNKKDNTLTYKEACKWVEEHYTKTESKGKVTKHQIIWDYTKNVKDESMPKKENLPEPLQDFAEKDINFLAAYSMVTGWKDLGLTEEEALETSGNLTKEGKGEFPIKLMPMNIDEFKEQFDDENRRFEYTFSVKNDALIITHSYRNGWPIAQGTDIYAYWWQIDTIICDKEGYPAKLKWAMECKDTVINFNIPVLSYNKTVNFGELHLSLEDSIAEVTPLN